MVITAPTPQQRRRFILLGISSFLLFCVASYLVYINFFSQADYSSMVGLQQVISRSADAPFSLLTLLGSAELTIVGLGLFALWLWVRKKYFPWGLAFLSLVFLVEIFGKTFLIHTHPPADMNRYTLHFSFPSSSYAPSDFSFPSGHMARSAYVATLALFFVLQQRRGAWQKSIALGVIGLYVVIIFVSRVYLGAHWISDVIGGMFLGFSAAAFSIAFW